MRRRHLPENIIALFDSGLLIDPDDLDLLLLPGLKINKRGYLSAKFKGRDLKLHRIILERKEGRSLSPSELCDHRFGNKLDNRRKNLRVATPRENMRNRHTVRNKHGFFGLAWHPRNKAFLVRIQGKVNGKKVLHYFSYHKTAIEAAKAYNRAAERLGFLTRNIIPDTH